MTQLFHQFPVNAQSGSALSAGVAVFAVDDVWCLRENCARLFPHSASASASARRGNGKFPQWKCQSCFVGRSVARSLAVAEWKITCYARCCVPFQTKFKETSRRASEATFTNFVAASPPLPTHLGIAARILPLDTWDFVNVFAETAKPPMPLADERGGMSAGASENYDLPLAILSGERWLMKPPRSLVEHHILYI